jgi:hypothetical protein
MEICTISCITLDCKIDFLYKVGDFSPALQQFPNKVAFLKMSVSKNEYDWTAILLLAGALPGT